MPWSRKKNCRIQPWRAVYNRRYLDILPEFQTYESSSLCSGFYSSYSITEQAREMLLPEEVSYLVMLCICLYRSGQVSELFFFSPHLSSFGRKSMKGVNHFSRPEAVWHCTSRLLLPLQCLHKHAGSSLHLTSACINIMIVFSFFVSSINSFSISEYKFVIKLYFMCFYEPLN